jgi:hypothetical protein
MPWKQILFPDGASGLTRVEVGGYFACHLDPESDLTAQMAKTMPMIQAAVRCEARSPSVFPGLNADEQNLILKMDMLESFLNPLALNGGVLTISIDFILEIDVLINIS